MWVVHEKHTVPARCKSRAHAMHTTLWMSPSHVLACVHAANTTQAFGITRPCMLNERACMCVWWWQPSTAQASKFVTGLSRLNSEPVMHCTPSRKQGSATVRHAQNEDQCSTLARCRVICTLQRHASQVLALACQGLCSPLQVLCSACSRGPGC